jgi:hypothetical protein
MTDSHDASSTSWANPHTGLERWLGVHASHERTRFIVLRLLGFVYTAAFLSLAWQVVPLIGSHGILPATREVNAIVDYAGSSWKALLWQPSLFYFVAPSDALLRSLAWLGVALSLAVTLGVSHAGVMIVLWVLYRSFVAIGQIWYGYGWELLLLEAGFLAIFACSWRSLTPRTPWPWLQVWLWRWLALRVMLGAGLIKLRGDSCWRDLTCLDFHFETQPLPNPFSPLFHALPHWVHAGGVLFNHVAELILPLCLFGPRKLRAIAGLGMIAFQLTLIASGNLSFLNWLTIVPLLASFDDAQLPLRLQVAHEPAKPSRLTIALALLIGALSIGPVANMLSPRQAMNAGFDPLMIVNTYGAFGSVGRERPELIIQAAASEEGPWQSYELPYKPGDLNRRPGVISPLQPRLDWQLWFAAMSQIDQEPWLIELVLKLLSGEPAVKPLFARDPFPSAPPKWLRVLRYRYRFAPLSADAYWIQDAPELYLPPVSRADLRELE